MISFESNVRRDDLRNLFHWWFVSSVKSCNRLKRWVEYCNAKPCNCFYTPSFEIGFLFSQTFFKVLKTFTLRGHFNVVYLVFYIHIIKSLNLFKYVLFSRVSSQMIKIVINILDELKVSQMHQILPQILSFRCHWFNLIQLQVRPVIMM